MEQLQSKSDLSGTKIISSDAVLVLSGSSWTPVSTGNYLFIIFMSIIYSEGLQILRKFAQL